MKKTLTIITISLIVGFILSWILKPSKTLHSVNDIIYVDTVYTHTVKTDTVTIAKFDYITNTVTDTIIKPIEVVKIDTYFVFNEIRTYQDSILDSFYKFKYEYDVIGMPLAFRYTMNTSFPIVTKTKEIHKRQIAISGLVGNSIIFMTDYQGLQKPLIYGIAADPFKKEFYFRLGYVLKW